MKAWWIAIILASVCLIGCKGGDASTAQGAGDASPQKNATGGGEGSNGPGATAKGNELEVNPNGKNVEPGSNLKGR